MDRRQRKSREAIFAAFTELLSQKSFNAITVGEIIARADVGRATFYAHFETKDFLLKELCSELFCHIFDAATGTGEGHRHIFDCSEGGEVFLHLIRHIDKNDHGICTLLGCENNELFLHYFKESLLALLKKDENLLKSCPPALPKDFWSGHICSVFVETVKWWLSGGKKITAEEVNDYFLLAAGLK